MSSYQLTQGYKIRLEGKQLMSDGSRTGDSLAWSCSPAGVIEFANQPYGGASVDVVGIGVGTTTVTVTDGVNSATLSIQVTAPTPPTVIGVVIEGPTRLPVSRDQPFPGGSPEGTQPNTPG